MNPRCPVISTRVAQMGERNHLFAGHEVFAELLGKESLSSLLALSAGLPRLSRGDVTMLDDLATVLMLCDQRIWPVKLTRLVASYGNALHGFSAGNLMHANLFIGAGPCQRGAPSSRRADEPPRWARRPGGSAPAGGGDAEIISRAVARVRCPLSAGKGTG